MARTSNLSSLTFQQIQSELRRRHRKAAVLQRRRDRLARKLESLDGLILAMGGRATGRVRFRAGGGRRPKNEKPLAEALHEVLKGTTMRVTDLTEAVQKAGYRTRGKTFRTQVNIALIKNPKLFKRVGRGTYTSK